MTTDKIHIEHYAPRSQFVLTPDGWHQIVLAVDLLQSMQITTSQFLHMAETARKAAITMTASCGVTKEDFTWTITDC